VKVEGTENLADALTKYVESDMLDKHIRGSECEVIEGRHELMPEVQSSEICSEEKQDEEIGDQEEDQLGHLGCLSHKGHNHNYQHSNNNDNKCSSENHKGHNNNQTDKKEREPGYGDPREENSSDSNINATPPTIIISSDCNTKSLNKASTTCPTEAKSIRYNRRSDRVQQPTTTSSDNNCNNNPLNRSDNSSDEENDFDSVCCGGSLTPTQHLEVCSATEMFALVGHETPLRHRPFEDKVFALVGHRHLRNTYFWIELGALSCAHLIRRGAGNIARISPYGKVCMTFHEDSGDLIWLKEKSRCSVQL
jgi:hypothetical protein